jgi:hypothetical protein
VTDELLAEGQAGCYLNGNNKGVNCREEEPRWTGPFYGDEIRRETYKDLPEYMKGTRGGYPGFSRGGRGLGKGI